MTLKLMLASATLALTAAGAAHAGPAKSMGLPKQPVPYTMLDAYLKASPKARADMLANASSPAAQSDASATVGAASPPEASSDTSETTKATPKTSAPAATSPDMSSGSMSMPSGSTDMPSGPVNPPSATPPPADTSSDQGASGTAAPAKP